MLVGGMVYDEVHNDLDAALVALCTQRVPIFHGAELVHDLPVPGDVVAVVVIRRAEHGEEPQRVGCRAPKDGQGGLKPGNIADTVSVRILKAARVDLIHDKILHPIFFLFHTTLPPVQYPCILRKAAFRPSIFTIITQFTRI